MRILKYLLDKEYMEKKKTAVSEIPDKITLEYFSDLVKSMRHQQRRYFATRSKEVLAESKKLEAQVDAVIAKLYDKQMSLF